MNEDLQQSPESPADPVPPSDTPPETRPETPPETPPEASELPAVEPASRPSGVPDKFWDRDAGTIRTEALLKSYLELERKLGSMVPLPSDEDPEARQRLQRALGVPASAEEYQIETRDEWLAPDPEINNKLHEAGFTQQQAQLVYDLAADHLLPVLDTAVGEVEATREAERLAAHFGADAWPNMARQIDTWGRANLAPEVFATLASSHDGVLAMHQMMQAREPAVLRDADGPQSDLDENALVQMMRDPRYWRDRDPALVSQVTDGFRRLYPS